MPVGMPKTKQKKLKESTVDTHRWVLRQRAGRSKRIPVKNHIWTGSVVNFISVRPPFEIKLKRALTSVYALPWLANLPRVVQPTQ